MEIKDTQIPHRYRNRFLRDNNGSVTVNKNSSNTNNSAASFQPVNLWGRYFDDTEDIKGDLEQVGSIFADGSVNAYSAYVADSLDVSGLTTTHDIVPEKTDTYTLGQQGLRWLEMWCKRAGIETADISTLIAKDASIDTIVSRDITTEYLKVTKEAHFFKLIIDELKAVGGQVILSPARATIDLVEQLSNGSYRCYFMAKDGQGRQLNNEFIVNDQAICQTFNVAQGVNYNVGNKYYWRLVTEVNSATVTKTINGEEIECHYITLSNTDKDGSSVPAAGDEIVQLGYRGTDDAARQSAIILAAY